MNCDRLNSLDHPIVLADLIPAFRDELALVDRRSQTRWKNLFKVALPTSYENGASEVGVS